MNQLHSHGKTEHISQIDLRSISSRSIWDRYMESRWICHW